MRGNLQLRIRIIGSFFIAISCILLIRLYSVQVVHGEHYRGKSLSQHGAPSVHSLERGTIFFTSLDKELVSAATIQSGYTLAITPRLIVSPEETYKSLQEVIPNLSRDDFIAKASRTSDPYEEVMRRVPPAQYEKIKKLSLPGVQLYREEWRYYPGKDLAAHSLGFVGQGTASSSVVGQYGLERYYQEPLSRVGTDTSFMRSLFTDVGTRLLSTEQDPGGDLVTTIEPTVQATLESLLSTYNAKWNAKSVGGIILDPSTGSVIAMAALPTYDPNTVKDADPLALSNPLIENVYEFGSTMKPITMAAALDAGVITETSTYTDTGFVTLNEKKISNFDGRARGVVPMQQVLSQSLNVGIAHIVRKMGIATSNKYFESFGLREETGVDLPSEATPLTSNLDSKKEVEFATAGFGQGIAITPIAMARSLAVLANDGKLVQPHVGTELRYPGGVVKKLGWSPERQVVSPETAQTVTRMLVRVVDEALKNGTAKNPTMSIAAKTGTAQIANPEGGGYYKDRYLHSFFTYFPAYNPRFLIFLYSVEPQGAQYASDTWTEPFKSITSFMITYYRIPPDRVATSTVQ